MEADWSSAKFLRSAAMVAANIIPIPIPFVCQFPSGNARNFTSKKIASVLVTSEAISAIISSAAAATAAVAIAAAAAARKSKTKTCLSEVRHMYHQYYILISVEDSLMSLLSYRGRVVNENSYNLKLNISSQGVEIGGDHSEI